MRVKRAHLTAASLFVAVIGLSFTGGTAMAALDQKPVLDDINDCIAVLHGLELRKLDIEDNLAIVHASYNLTSRQHEAQKKLYESEVEKAKTLRNQDKNTEAAIASKRAEFFKARLDQLERQMNKLKQFDFDALYAPQLKSINEQIALTRLGLEARTAEYNTLFGEPPHVDLTFLDKLREERGKRKDIEYYLKLD